MKEEKLDTDSSEKKTSIGLGIWIVLVVIFLVWGAYWAWVAPRVTGNQFDPLNTLFSGLAFWGVIYAILLQKSELSLQRKELELTRGEVRGQKEQLETQNTTLKQQRFENTFFSLLDLFNSIVDSMEVGVLGLPMKSLKGRECFRQFYDDFQREYTGQRIANSEWGHRTLCVAAYERFVAYRQTYVGHYFRTLCNIIKFISTSEVGNKQIYINIARAQLSSSELNLLFYNCLSKYGDEKFKPFVEQFGLLENMTIENLCDQQHRELYKESAFKNQL